MELPKEKQFVMGLPQ
jgi:hypothetical protein